MPSGDSDGDPSPHSSEPKHAAPPPQPTAPSLPESYGQVGHHQPTYAPPNYYGQQHPQADYYGQQQQHPQAGYYGQQPQHPQAGYYGQQQQQHHPQPSYGQHPPYGQYSSSLFPAGTDPNVIRSFEMVDRDRSGYIDEIELQQALCSGYQQFSLRTIKLLISIYKNPTDSRPIIGPKEFAAVWSCLAQWRDIFTRFDKDRSGKINSTELRDALYSIGYAVPPSVLQVLLSKYTNKSGMNVELDFDTFIECGMIVRGLTEKFKEKDPRYTGSATLPYETFMCIVIPFIV